MLDHFFDRPLQNANPILPVIQPPYGGGFVEPLVPLAILVPRGSANGQMLPTLAHSEILGAGIGSSAQISTIPSNDAVAAAVRAAVAVDNTLATAQKLGAITGTRDFVDSVSGSDPNDFYQFTLNSTSTYRFSLNGLSADADLDLLDRNGRVLYSSNNGGNTAEVLSGSLAAGTYYLQIYSYGSAQTNYNLQLMSQAVAIDLAGNTLAAAKNLGAIAGTQTFQDFVGSTDGNDYYRFTLAKGSNFSLNLSGLQSDADVELLDSRGQQIAYSNGAGNVSESLQQLLSAGTYYVRVFSYASADTRYSLKLVATVSTAIDAGNTLATARNIGLLSGDRSFQDNLNITDLNDYYRFTLNRYSAFYYTVNGLAANADVQLLNSKGETLTASTASGVIMESGKRALEAGTYYLRVLSVVGVSLSASSYRQNTSYNLRMVANPLAPDSGGNSLATARNLGILGSNRTWQDFVGSRDAEDYYRFILPRTSNFSLSLFGLGADADVQLLNANGQVITASTNGSNLSESITRLLSAGVYYIQVSRYSGDTLYDLRLGAIPTASGFSSIYGYGLANGALAIERSLGRTTVVSTVSTVSSQWNQNLINAPAAWRQGYTGQGIIVAVIDSGVNYRHADLDSNIWRNTREIAGNGIDDDHNGYIDDVRGWDFVQNDNNPMDVFGHGTHLAGTIAAENNGLGVTGVAYGARIMPVRVLGDDGRGSYANIARGVRYAVDNDARVINLSLGGGGGSALLDGAIAYASQKGVIVVIAAGNEGADAPNYPGRLATRYGVVVGGVTQERREYLPSNRSGTDTTLRYIVAPATNILSTTVGGGYQLMSGTSMAAAHISGLVALMLGANPRLTVEEVRSILTSTATQLV
jgi:trimeric autotransporter adhesin